MSALGIERAGTLGGDQLNAPPLEHGEADLLDHQVTGETRGGLDDDGANAVPFDALQHGGEAGCA